MKDLLLVVLMALMVGLPGCAAERAKALNLEYKRVVSLHDEGWKHMEQKQYEAAEKSFLEARKLNDEILTEVGDSEYVHMEDRTYVDKLSTSIFLGLGEAMFFQGKLSEAISPLDMVWYRHLNYCLDNSCKEYAVIARYYESRVNNGLKKFDEAIGDASWAIENADKLVNLSEAYLQRAIAYAESGRYGQALADGDWILKNGRSQDVWPAYALKCRISLVTGDYGSASLCGQKLVDNFPANSEGYSLKGVALVLSGNAEGYKYCRKALELNPNDSRAKSCLKIGK